VAEAPGARLSRLAPAKVNLFLRIVGKRPDGYHDLETLFQTVRWGDEVEVRRIDVPAAGPNAYVASTWIDEMKDGTTSEVGADLATEAARLWAAPWTPAIRIVKRIPIGGGLGGGSSDAATVLLLLNRLAPATRPRRMEEIAASLGSDVPFFLVGDGAIGRGRGEVLEPLPSAPPLTLVLIVPPFGTETARVFARAHERVRHAPEDGLARAVAARASGDPAAVREAHHNDLAEAAIRAYPPLLRYTASVERALGRPPCLSGSGSTLYDVVAAAEAPEVVARLAALPGRRHVVVTGGVP
jgi:4-diphosphocytidyl-2-C-methyl-D-erythritol kinase